jgi:hypothetical protein
MIDDPGAQMEVDIAKSQEIVQNENQKRILDYCLEKGIPYEIPSPSYNECLKSWREENLSNFIKSNLLTSFWKTKVGKSL